MGDTWPRVLHESHRDDWATPSLLFRMLDREFHFDLDPCASSENAKCERFYTKEQDGLRQPWTGRVFCNPPYGRQVGLWIRKGYEAVRSGEAKLVVFLVFARTDTAWFQDYAMLADEIRFIRGRVAFDATSKRKATAPSCVVVFRPGCMGSPTITGMRLP